MKQGFIDLEFNNQARLTPSEPQEKASLVACALVPGFFSVDSEDEHSPLAFTGFFLPWLETLVLSLRFWSLACALCESTAWVFRMSLLEASLGQ